MASSDIERRVTLICPVCGGDQFESDEHDDAVPVTCAACGRKFSRDELTQANHERIEAEIHKMGEQALEDAAKDLRKLGFK